MKIYGIRIILGITVSFFSMPILAVELKPGETFAYELVDYTKAPVYKQIKKHPEHYTYLEKTDIYSIRYRSEGLVITGFMAAPKTDGKYPLVIFNRGGNRDYGSLLVSSGTDVLAPIAAEGYVVVAGNYRGNSGSEGVEEFGGSDVMDVINLAKTSSTFPKASNEKIGLLGISRGGMMNYLALRRMNEHGLNVACAIAIGGITDLEKTIVHHPQIGTVCEEIIPGFEANKAAELQKRSAVFWVNELPGTCPLLILHSYDDAAVTYDQIPAFADSLDRYNKQYQLISYQNDNHGIINHRQHVQEQIQRWLNVYLKGEEDTERGEKRLVAE